jgi:hypothetical protein
MVMEGAHSSIAPWPRRYISKPLEHIGRTNFIMWAVDRSRLQNRGMRAVSAINVDCADAAQILYASEVR